MGNENKKAKPKGKPKGKRGVPAGYEHNWKYGGHWKEKKQKDGSWKVDFSAAKRRKGSAKGGLPIGSKIRWRIEGIQIAEKVSGRTYKTRFRAKKTLIKVDVAKRRKPKGSKRARGRRKRR